MATLTPFRGHNITVKKRTPPPSSGITPKTKATRSSEKETPTVVFTQCPLILNGDNDANATSDNDEMSRDETTSNHDFVYSNSAESSQEDHPYAKATNMMQITLECGIASICRLRKLFPSSFFQKQDVEGTTVSNFDVGLIEDIFAGSLREEDGKANGDEEGTMSPLTATQKTHNTTQFTHHTTTERMRVVDDGDRKAATEALMLLRWIGKQGVNVIMKQNRLASVIFGIMLPNNDDGGEDELLEQYVFQFGRDVPTQPSDPALSQAQHAMSSLFQNLNGFSVGNSRLSQAVVPMMTQGTIGTYTQASAMSQFEYLQSQQTEDVNSVKSRCSRRPSQNLSLSQKYSQSAASMSQMSMLESMNHSIKISVKRHKGARIPSERYLTLRIEFTESLASRDLPDVLRSCNSINPKPQTKDMVVTPLGIVAEENCTGLSVAMTAYSKSADSKSKNDMVVSAKSSSSQLLIDESIMDEEGFKPFTQMELDNYDDNSSKSAKIDNNSTVESKKCQNKASTKRKSINDSPNSNKKPRCISPLPASHYVPGTEAFGIPSYGDNGSIYLKCTIHDHRQSPDQYKVEFVSNALKKKKQWIPAKKVVLATEMRKQIESALKTLDCDGEEELIETVAANLSVSVALVGVVLSKM